MSTTYIIIAAVLILLVMGAIMAPIFARRNRSKRYGHEFGHEYTHTVETTGSEKKAQAELDARRKHVGTLNIRPLTGDERVSYTADWTAIQANFVDEPAKATVAADRLVTQVMEVRDYPVSDFEQRAADISISHPAFVTNYRAAREIAIRNEQDQADTEELRHALIYYRNLFDELLGKDTDIPEMKKNGKAQAEAPKAKVIVIDEPDERMPEGSGARESEAVDIIEKMQG